MASTRRISPSGPDEWTDKAREMFAFFEGPDAGAGIVLATSSLI